MHVTGAWFAIPTAFTAVVTWDPVERRCAGAVGTNTFGVNESVHLLKDRIEDVFIGDELQERCHRITHTSEYNLDVLILIEHDVDCILFTLFAVHNKQTVNSSESLHLKRN